MRKQRAPLNISISNREGVAVIDIYGFIGDDPFAEEEDKNTKDWVKDQLREIEAIEADKIIVNISSLGGSTDDAFVIYDLLRSHEATVETKISGYTASSGTIIAMAGDKVSMSENSLFLIHRSHSLAMGNKFDLERMAKDLEKTDERISNIYSKKGGEPREFYMDWMDKENGNGVWLDANEVKDELHLIDEILESEYEKAASVSEDEIKKLGLPVPDNGVKLGEDIKERDTKTSDSNELEYKIRLDTTEAEHKLKDLGESIGRLQSDFEEVSDQIEASDSKAARERELLLKRAKN